MVNGLVSKKPLTARTQRMMPYPTMSKDGRTSKAFWHQATICDVKYYVGDKTRKAYKRKEMYELRFNKTGLPDHSGIVW